MKYLFTATFIMLITVVHGQTKLYIPGGGGSIVNISGNNIGMGINTPSATLHINGNLKTATTINANEYISVDKDGSYRVSINGQADGYITGRNDQVVQKFLITSNGNSFFNGGNVGIGTHSPSATLHVVGNIKTTAQITAAEYVTVDGSGGYRVAINGQGDGYVVGRNNNLEKKFQISSNGISYINGGNLLINKTSQTNTSYKLDVEGKIRANEIVVNTTGADFVFEPAYNLPKLEFVEQFIRENRHLPEIPSAAVMQEEGMSVGELNTKLLQKVEELTLYLIEQNKRIEYLESKIEEK